MSEDGVFEVVRDAYDSVYGALARSPTFARIWREEAYGGQFPEEFAHIGFLTLDEATRMLDRLSVAPSGTLLDVACGAGGPGLWAISRCGATLIGVDPSRIAIYAARARAEALGVADEARFQLGTFENTGLVDHSASAIMSVEAFQYAPDKRAALSELHRVLKPGGRLALVCFEVDPVKSQGLPVLGVDPVNDYAPLLERCGFAIDVYEETPGWERRVYGAFSALIQAQAKLSDELGEAAAAGVIAEALATTQLQPYPRRVLVVAMRT